MGQYLIDNNVISNYFSGLFPANAMHFIAEIIDQIPNLSVITEIEALSWISPDKNKENVVRQFISESNVLTISPAIVHQCVKIRRNKKIKTPDAIIAATAIIHNYTLVSSDSDFNNIEGLITLNPYGL